MNEWILVVMWMVYTSQNHGVAMQEFIGENACLKAGQEIVRQVSDVKFICVPKRSICAVKRRK
jgi:hypothetical protein